MSPDLGVPLLVAILDNAGAIRAALAASALEYHFADPPLQLLHCVWLC
jgi:hypothetical protein